MDRPNPATVWPEDPYRPALTQRPATTATQVGHQARAASSLAVLSSDVSVCRACPRLVAWRERVALEKRAAYADQPYWGRPVPGWGAAEPRIVILGLAPAAHGANRTSRIFTGDRSGDWLFASLFRVGLASQPTSVDATDGMRLFGTRMIASVRCAPPENKPTPGERDTCAPWLDAELRLVSDDLRVIVALGAFGWQSGLRAAIRLGWTVPRPRPRFGHGADAALLRDGPGGEAPVRLLGCYHPSQHNTATGRLTATMLDDVLGRARELADG